MGFQEKQYKDTLQFYPVSHLFNLLLSSVFCTLLLIRSSLPFLNWYPERGRRQGRKLHGFHHMRPSPRYKST